MMNCACGTPDAFILKFTSDWKYPMCQDCFAGHGAPRHDPAVAIDIAIKAIQLNGRKAAGYKALLEFCHPAELHLEHTLEQRKQCKVCEALGRFWQA